MGFVIPFRFFLILAAFFMPFARVQGQISPNPGASMTFSLEDSHVALHAPVVVKFGLKNNSDDDIRLDLGRDRKANFVIAVTPPSGPKVQLQPPIRSGFTRIGAVTVKPGEIYTQELLLNEWMDFTTPGLYEIEARLAKSAYADSSNSLGGQDMFRTRLEVTPRNELALAKTCEGLASQVEAFSSYESASQAALELSYIADPIAVPYLRRVLLAKKLVEPIAIRGLEKIASKEAIQAISLGMEIEYNDTSSLARAALLRIESRTPDPMIKKEIIGILSGSNKSRS